MAKKRVPEKQGKNKDYEVGYKKPPKATQFKKGQSGNPHGRPKDHAGLRKLIQSIAQEARKDGQTEITAMVRKMFKSRNSADRKEILEHGWGKAKDEVEKTENITITVVYDESDRPFTPPAPATASVHSKSGQTEDHPGRPPQR